MWFSIVTNSHVGCAHELNDKSQVFYLVYLPQSDPQMCVLCFRHIKMSQSADTQKEALKPNREKLTFNRIMSISEYFIPFTRTGVNLSQNMEKHD